MKSLVVVIPKLDLGGAQRSLIKLVNAVGDKFGVIHVVCLAGADAAMVKEFERPDCIRLHKLQLESTANPAVWVRLWRLLRNIRPSIVLGWSTYANLCVIVATRGLPQCRIVISERCYVPRLYGKSAGGSKLRKRFTCWAIRLLYRRAHCITANSEQNLLFLRKYIGTGPEYHVLPNTVDMIRIDDRATREPIPSLPIIDGPRLLALGRLDYQKGFDILLHALQILRKDLPWSLVVVGEGAEERALRTLADELGLAHATHWLGKANNPFPYYRWADLVLVPSRYEGFPNVALEAMALGRAVICSDCQTGPREMTEGGRYGRLVPVGDAVLLAEAIRELGEDLEARVQLGASARAHIQAHYSQDVSATCYLSVLLGSPG